MEPRVVNQVLAHVQLEQQAHPILAGKLALDTLVLLGRSYGGVVCSEAHPSGPRPCPCVRETMVLRTRCRTRAGGEGQTMSEAGGSRHGSWAVGAALAAAILGWSQRSEAQPSFPGAEGFGAAATGGRGGQVLKVTTLASSGPGSLQWALDQQGPRIVVFDVSGVIEGDVNILHGDVTIAGQTAPGGGITLHGRLYAEYDASVRNIVVRFLRVRPPPLTAGSSGGDQYDGIQISLNSLVMLDHISVSWGSDETVDLYEADDVTIQWSTIEESSTEGHSEGEHNYGLINGPDGHRISIHHNLFAHHKNRCPAVANGPADIRNNVVYDVRHAFVHHNPASGQFNIVGNTYREGPSADIFPFYFDDEAGGSGNPQYYLHNNYIDDPSDGSVLVDDPWADPSAHPTFADMLGQGDGVSTEFDFSSEAGFVPVGTDEVMTAYDRVLAMAGAFPRDVVTVRTMDEVAQRSGSWGAHPPADLMEGLAAGSAPSDADGDGMPDDWETAHGLDPASSGDTANVMASGYTAIEEYLNERAAEVLGADPGSGGSGGSAGSGGSGGSGGSAGAVGGSAGDPGTGGAAAGAPSTPGASPSSEEASGCACRVHRARTEHAPAWGVIGLALLWYARRRAAL